MLPLRRHIGFARALGAALACAVCLAACSSPDLISGPQFVTRGGGDSADARLYRLGVGDKFKLSVFGEDNLSGQFEVNAEGKAALPLIGELRAQGLSVEEFRTAIVRKLSDGYLKSPKVAIEMSNFRPIYVHGEVKNAGEFQYKNGLKLRDAIAMAGGYTYRADQAYLVISRDGAADAAVKLPADIALLPGDNIRVPERFF